MIELLDDLTEIPFEIFWDKYQELKPNLFYNREKAEIQWFRMKEVDRVISFTNLSKGWYDFKEPYLYLEYHSLPF
jgi:hypothetical protein